MRVGVYILAGVIAIGAGAAVSRFWVHPPTVVAAPAASSIVESPLTDLDGSVRYLKEWRGKVLLVNFWATWCAPCRVEIPLIQRARAHYQDRDFEVVGVAIDEQKLVQDFRDEMGIKYPLLLAGDDAIDLLIDFGNEVGALPHTAILSASGDIVATHTGPLTAEQLDQLIQKHL